jgi:hypothetical protein
LSFVLNFGLGINVWILKWQVVISCNWWPCSVVRMHVGFK